MATTTKKLNINYNIIPQQNVYDINYQDTPKLIER